MYIYDKRLLYYFLHCIPRSSYLYYVYREGVSDVVLTKCSRLYNRLFLYVCT